MAKRKSGDKNFNYVWEVKRQHNLTHEQLAELSEHSVETVKAWFTGGVTRQRKVSDRAVTIIKLKLEREAA